MKRKVGFVLSGGGLSGAYTVGHLKAVTAKGIKPKYLQGVSVGSLTGAEYLISGVEGVEKKWLNVQTLGQSSIFNRKDIPFNMRSSSLFGNQRAFNLLIKDLDFQALVDSPVEFQIITAREATKTRKVFSNRDEKIKKDPSQLGKILLASIGLPGFLPPVLVNGEWHSDGNVFKLSEAIRAKCDTIFIFLNHPITVEEHEEKDFGKMKWYQRFVLGMQILNQMLIIGEVKRAVEAGYELIQNNPSPVFDDVIKRPLLKQIKRKAKKLTDDIDEVVHGDVALGKIFTQDQIALITPSNAIASLYTIGLKQPDPKIGHPGDVTAAIEECSTFPDSFWKQVRI